MKRKEFSESELNRVIKLKQLGYSWLKIQKEANIPRRSAKKVYDTWIKNQAREELKSARMNVATEEFREHLSDLIMIANAFVEYLPETIYFSETRDADAVIDDIWKRDLTEKGEFMTAWENRLERERNRIIRKNKLLFQSLQDHTREKQVWQVLQDLKNNWDLGTKVWFEITKEVVEIVANISKGRRDEVINISKINNLKNLSNSMVKGIVEAVWRGVLEGKPGEGFTYIQIRHEGDQKILVVFGYQGSIESIPFTNQDNAEIVRDICVKAAEIICRGEKVEKALDIMRHLKKNVEEIEIMLEPVKLKPLILRTRCDICPA